MKNDHKWRHQRTRTENLQIGSAKKAKGNSLFGFAFKIEVSMTLMESYFPSSMGKMIP